MLKEPYAEKAPFECSSPICSAVFYKKQERCHFCGSRIVSRSDPGTISPEDLIQDWEDLSIHQKERDARFWMGKFFYQASSTT